MRALNIILLLVFCCIGFALNSCQGDKKGATASKKVEAAAPVYESKLAKVAQIMSQCDKAEYLMYDMGMTFETQSNNEVMRFLSYIKDEPANVSQCKKNKYDGSVVFKDPEGDIKMAMEFNVLNNCNRVVYEIDGKKISNPLSEYGIQFFNQVLGNRPPTPQPK